MFRLFVQYEKGCSPVRTGCALTSIAKAKAKARKYLGQYAEIHDETKPWSLSTVAIVKPTGECLEIT